MKLIKTKKAILYILVYSEYDVIKKSLDCLGVMSNYFDIVVIQNQSPHTLIISKYIDYLGSIGIVNRHYIFKENIAGSAYGIVLSKELMTLEKYSIIVISDGDVTMINTKNWFKEAKKILDEPNIFACGVSLETSNLPLLAFPEAREWIPPAISKNSLYEEGLTGIHMLAMKSKNLIDYINWSNTNKRPFVDGEMHKYCYDLKKLKWARTIKNTAYHITWDLYKEPDNLYTKNKLKTSFLETWHKRKESDYKLITY